MGSDTKPMGGVKRWVSPYAAGTESYKRLVDAGDRTEPDHDEGPFFVLATDYASLTAEVAALREVLEQMRQHFPRVGQLLNKLEEEWKAAGCWSEWDASVMAEQRAVHAAIEAALKSSGVDRGEM